MSLLVTKKQNGVTVYLLASVFLLGLLWGCLESRLLFVLQFLAFALIVLQERKRLSGFWAVVPNKFIFFGYIIWCLLTAIWSEWHGITLMRGSLQVVEVASLFLTAFVLHEEKERVFFTLLFWLNVFIVVSLAVSLTIGIPADRWSGGNALGFKGIFGHQNSAAAFLLFTIPGVLYKLFTFAERVSWKKLLLIRGIPIVMLISGNLIFILLSGSRSVIVSLVIMIVIISFLWGSVTKPLLFWGIVLVTGSLLFITYTPVRQGITLLVYKHADSPAATRIPMYLQSWEGAKDGGFTGLGFGVSDPAIKSDIGRFDGTTFIREKGNSVLALIEETGFIGLVFFLMFYFKSFAIFVKRFRENKEKNANRIIISFLPAIFIHAQFEGWWGGVSSFYFLVLLFIAGCAMSEYDVKKGKHIFESAEAS